MGQGTKRNHPCWCGSGKKLKKCHYRRDEEKPLPVSDALAGFKRAHRPRKCLHPEASEERCSGQVISSHSIQRQGSLAHIAARGHVLGFTPEFGQLKKTGGRIEPRRLGLKKASTFPGFCSSHDRSTFAPIETDPIVPTPEQAFLLSYRALSKELFQKQAQSEVMSRVLQAADRGRSPMEQVLFQTWRADHALGTSLGSRDLEREKRLHDEILLNETWSKDYCFLGVPITSRPTVVSSGAIIPECDFAGNALAELGRADVECDLLAFSIVATEAAGLAVWACRAESVHGMSFLRQAATLSDEALVQGAVRFAFEFIENTFISPDWWDALPTSKRETVIRRANSGIFDDPGRGRLQDDRIQLVEWTVGARVAHLNDPTPS